MKKTLLFEIGTEEIPAHVVPKSLKELGEKAENALKELRLDFGEVKTLGTPRRLALIVTDLADCQADVREEHKGPAVKIAFDENHNPTKAAAGFARGKGVAPEDLVEKDGYVYAVVEKKGEATEKLLRDVLPNLITSLSFPNHMRWGSLDFKFIRPIRWIVALYGEDVIPFEIANVKSDRKSRGHRALYGGEFSIASAGDYEADCEKAFVIVDPEKRRKKIVEGLKSVAEEKGGVAEITEDLLEEVLYLVEYPTPLAGSFEEAYLSLPEAAVITPMRDHQRYFPVRDSAGKLMPLFLTVRNGGKEHLDTVAHGNERVLKARLEDAKFFFEEDRKKTLEEHRERLKTVVFQEGLGSVYEKTERLAELSKFLCDAFNSDEKTRKHAEKAALISKADLVTGMVTEFTELQGVMGREYALLEGRCEGVATAIDEQYMPRFAGDELPKTDAGKILSLADKIDNIVGTFSRGKIPTGSQDPFALRRQALGFVGILTEAKLHLSLNALVAKAMELYKKSEVEAMQQNVADFMRLRLKNLFTEKGIRYDVMDAVLENVDDPYATLLRAEAVGEFVKTSESKNAIQAFNRVGNLAKNATRDNVDEALFKETSEGNLYNAYKKVKTDAKAGIAAGDYKKALYAFTELTGPINEFFDAVMVMDKDEKIKENRLALLKGIDDMIKEVAAFDKIVLA